LTNSAGGTILVNIGEISFMHTGTKSTDTSQVRLVAAGFLSLALLVWVTAFDDSWGLMFRPIPSHALLDSYPIMITAGISLLTLGVLAPVLFRGRRKDRWLAVAFAILPFFTLGVAAFWLL
jgi:hypothetical protein